MDAVLYFCDFSDFSKMQYINLNVTYKDLTRMQLTRWDQPANRYI